jgi:hypothetical protein
MARGDGGKAVLEFPFAIVATTYANYRNEDIVTSIASVRFTMSEIDAMAAKLTLGSKP